jgi:1-aminocyclopropane-1-carboxylate deaminase/D-cysteine desulfhydrase-like pyridoxal-dependent ACC family enzyme
MFVWGAGVQSNNCRQTTAACAKAGIDCHLVLGRGRRADGPDLIQGNLLLDHLLGATYEINELAVGDGLSARVAEIADNFRAKGRTVYHFDPHVTEPLAAASYMLCMAEIVEQTSREGFVPDAVYISSAGGTGAGMALAARALGYSFPVRSICPIRWERDTQADMLRVANEIAERLGLATRLELDDIDVNFDYIPPGYNKASAGGLEAIALLARTEGVLLDPAYTGKAMAGLIDHSRQGKFAEHENVVFVHTGGTPALFAYNDELTSGIAGRTR